VWSATFFLRGHARVAEFNAGGTVTAIDSLFRQLSTKSHCSLCTRAAAMYSLLVTAKMNNIDPQVWLGGVLARIATYPAHRLDELLPWNWAPRPSAMAA